MGPIKICDSTTFFAILKRFTGIVMIGASLLTRLWLFGTYFADSCVWVLTLKMIVTMISRLAMIAIENVDLLFTEMTS